MLYLIQTKSDVIRRNLTNSYYKALHAPCTSIGAVLHQQPNGKAKFTNTMLHCGNAF